MKWLLFKPSFPDNGEALRILLDFGHAFSQLHNCETDQERNAAAERLRRCGLQAAASCKAAERQPLVAAIHVLADLVKQGWLVRTRGNAIQIARPDFNGHGDNNIRQRIRSQLHAERDAQLCKPAVRKFIQVMEARRLFGDQFVSIFSLMRDGRELADRLRELRLASDEHAQNQVVSSIIRPYLQFVSESDRCPWTGLRLANVWRYFRHTWANPYKTVPGRSIMILVRDAAAPYHPVIGIAALSSAAVALAGRDERIGWTSSGVLKRIAEQPTAEMANWLRHTIDQAINEIYTVDLIRRGLLTMDTIESPSLDLVKVLEAEAKFQRKQYYQMMEAKGCKKMLPPGLMTDADWVQQAEQPLFVSKRCQELTTLLKVRLVLTKYLGDKPGKDALARLIDTGEGRDAVTKIVRKIKADHVGTAIADLTVCGAVPPYNELLGGKLVAMMMTSPEVAAEYRRRYGSIPSIIASSMAGRPVVRPAELVFIGTTALYAQRPTQYDRISIPLNAEQAANGPALRYEYLGRTQGVGTFHFGEKTVQALHHLLANSRGGQRVNSVFGEGVNPRLRKLRGGLNALSLSSDELLQHGGPRLVYGVALAENTSEYLLGIEKQPRYLFSHKAPATITQQIVNWWYKRWLLQRVARDDVLERVARHAHTYPITHGARVPMPRYDLNESEL